MEVIDKTRELETKGIGHLLWIYALPSVISQIIASIYNIVDRIFIGHGVGAMAIAGLAITMPIMNIIHAFGSLIGVGSSARMSIVLGRKDVKWAEKILGNSMVFTIVLGFLFVTCGYLFMDDILSSFGATSETISYAREYMYIVLPGMFFTTMTFNLTGLIRASGYPMKSMFIMVGGAVLNMILDPIFIFGMHLGIAGAAWATTISMTTTAIIAIFHFIQPSSFIRFKAHGWQPKGYIFKNITLIGMSPFLMNVCASFVVAMLNNQLLRYGGDYAVGTYGIVNTFGSLMVMLILPGYAAHRRLQLRRRPRRPAETRLYADHESLRPHRTVRQCHFLPLPCHHGENIHHRQRTHPHRHTGYAIPDGDVPAHRLHHRQLQLLPIH